MKRSLRHASLETEFFLNGWLNTAEFKSPFVKYRSTPNTLNEAILVRSFISDGKFNAGGETEKIAQKIINVFLQELDTALLQSPFSIPYHDAKEEQRNQGMRELVTQGFSTLENRISSHSRGSYS